MKGRLFAFSSAAAAALAIGAGITQSLAHAQQGQPSPLNPVAPHVMPRTPKNAAEFDQLFHQIKNWGRWGKDDELGAANLITDAKRKEAAALVKSGIAVSLSHDYLTE